jgi:hypothetical protein
LKKSEKEVNKKDFENLVLKAVVAYLVIK